MRRCPTSQKRAAGRKKILCLNEKGTRLSIEEKGDQLVLQLLTAEYFKKIAGITGTKGKGVTALLEERAKEKENEDKKWSKF